MLRGGRWATNQLAATCRHTLIENSLRRAPRPRESKPSAISRKSCNWRQEQALADSRWKSCLRYVRRKSWTITDFFAFTISERMPPVLGGISWPGIVSLTSHGYHNNFKFHRHCEKFDGIKQS